MLTGIVIGILSWQCILALLAAILKDNEDLFIRISFIVPFFFISLPYKLYNMARNIGLKTILTDGTTFYYCSPNKAKNILAKHPSIKPVIYDKDLIEKYPVSLWSPKLQERHCRMNIGNFRFAPKSVWKNFNKIA